jgi:stage IV sporulation protein FB
MLLEPPTTAWDLRWRMFGIPVRVHPMFWLVCLFMGQAALNQGAVYLLSWVACVFVSILIHELGHVAAGMFFGSRGHIVLHAFGGLAIGSNQLRERWQRIAVSLAGPGAGFLLLIALFGFFLVRDPADVSAYFAVAASELGFPWPQDADVLGHLRAMMVERRLEFAIVNDLIFINLLWGLLNLLPIWPLDGGQVSREVCENASPGRGLNLSLTISTATAGFLAVCAIADWAGRPILPFAFGSPFTAIMFGLLAWQSYQSLGRIQSQRRWTDDHWDRDD